MGEKRREKEGWRNRKEEGRKMREERYLTSYHGEESHKKREEEDRARGGSMTQPMRGE